MRFAFFSDLHIKGDRLQVEVDLGGPSQTLALQSQKALNELKPDVIFGLGDLTASGLTDDWAGYQQWLAGIEAPVFDLFGNHDRAFLPFMLGNYGEEYFSELGRVADTKVLQVGNLVFILLSEEHNPEFAGHDIIYTLANQRLNFLLNQLSQLQPSNNVFVLSHSPAAGTTFFSDVWAFNDYRSWQKISQRYLQIFKQFPPTAHLSGHIHINYKKRGKTRNLADGQTKKVGKFLKFNQPEMYFLNLPCVDTAHGYISSRLKKFYVFFNNLFRKNKSAHLYWKHENKGWPVVDWLLEKRNFLKPTVYYFDVKTGDKQVALKTHKIISQTDVESYSLKLPHTINLSQFPDKKLKLVASDLSLRTHSNLIMGDSYWFKILPDQQATAQFSQAFATKIKVERLDLQAQGLANYHFKWKGSADRGQSWTSTWINNPKQLPEINAVMLKATFKSKADQEAKVLKIEICQQIEVRGNCQKNKRE